MDQFANHPLEFVRLGSSLPAADVPTRRQAAADILRALVREGVREQGDGDWGDVNQLFIC